MKTFRNVRGDIKAPLTDLLHRVDHRGMSHLFGQFHPSSDIFLNVEAQVIADLGFCILDALYPGTDISRGMTLDQLLALATHPSS